MKDVLNRSELKFWVSIIGGVALTLSAFFNLRTEVIAAKKDIDFIRENIAEIKGYIKDHEEFYGNR